MNEDEKFMQIAILEAEKAKEKEEVPIGAIIVLSRSSYCDRTQ